MLRDSRRWRGPWFSGLQFPFVALPAAWAVLRAPGTRHWERRLSQLCLQRFPVPPFSVEFVEEDVGPIPDDSWFASQAEQAP